MSVDSLGSCKVSKLFFVNSSSTEIIIRCCSHSYAYLSVFIMLLQNYKAERSGQSSILIKC